MLKRVALEIRETSRPGVYAVHGALEAGSPWVVSVTRQDEDGGNRATALVAVSGEGEVMAIIQLGAETGLVAVITNLSFDAYEIPLSIGSAEETVRTLREPVLFDGRNLYDPRRMEEQGIEYHSVGRPPVKGR